MTRARTFRQRDVTAALKAAFAAGAARARIEVGGLIIIADKTADGIAVRHGTVNEWDAPALADGDAGR
jgi:hypothetical protein